MSKIVYNSCYGGFGISIKGIQRLAELGLPLAIDYLNNKDNSYFRSDLLPRHHPLLIQVVEELGEDANADFTRLKIKKIDGFIYKIEDFDGKEKIIEAGDDWIVIQSNTNLSY